jgi:hypothetical protein
VIVDGFSSLHFGRDFRFSSIVGLFFASVKICTESRRQCLIRIVDLESALVG